MRCIFKVFYIVLCVIGGLYGFMNAIYYTPTFRESGMQFWQYSGLSVLAIPVFLLVCALYIWICAILKYILFDLFWN